MLPDRKLCAHARPSQVWFFLYSIYPTALRIEFRSIYYTPMISTISAAREQLINSESRLALTDEHGRVRRKYRLIDEKATYFYQYTADDTFILLDRTEDYVLMAPITHDENLGSFADTNESIAVYFHEICEVN
jgi:hypothetical protein